MKLHNKQQVYFTCTIYTVASTFSHAPVAWSNFLHTQEFLTWNAIDHCDAPGPHGQVKGLSGFAACEKCFPTTLQNNLTLLVRCVIDR